MIPSSVPLYVARQELAMSCKCMPPLRLPSEARCSRLSCQGVGPCSRRPPLPPRIPNEESSMRVTMIILLISALALPLPGAAGPVVSPTQVTIRVGESVTLHGYQNAGGLSEGFPYAYEFYSGAPGVATVRGFASGTATTRPD